MRKKCPKTTTGRHIWCFEAFEYERDANLGVLGAKVVYRRCRECDLVDNAKNYKKKWLEEVEGGEKG